MATLWASLVRKLNARSKFPWTDTFQMRKEKICNPHCSSFHSESPFATRETNAKPIHKRKRQLWMLSGARNANTNGHNQVSMSHPEATGPLIIKLTGLCAKQALIIFVSIPALALLGNTAIFLKKSLFESSLATFLLHSNQPRSYSRKSNLYRLWNDPRERKRFPWAVGSVSVVHVAPCNVQMRQGVMVVLDLSAI